MIPRIKAETRIPTSIDPWLHVYLQIVHATLTSVAPKFADRGTVDMLKRAAAASRCPQISPKSLRLHLAVA